MATSTATTTSRGGMRIHVQRFGTFLSNMVLPNIAAFIAWGLITALFIETGWITLIGDELVRLRRRLRDHRARSAPGARTRTARGIVGPMITYLLPLLIGYTGGRMMYDDNIRGGVVGAIATMGAITGASVPMFLGAMVMGPLGGCVDEAARRAVGRQDPAGLRDAGQQLLGRHLGHASWRSSASSIAGPFVERVQRAGLRTSWTTLVVEPPAAAHVDLHRAGQDPVPQQRDQPRHPDPAGHLRGRPARQVDPVPARGQPRPGRSACCSPSPSSARASPSRRPPARS